MKISKGLSDYEMQLWLDEKGYKLYDETIDNEVDTEVLSKLAMNYGWVCEWLNGQWMWFRHLGIKYGYCK